ncbi:hypothetical protein EJB05_32537, partial [Eragrostis curvula]
METRPSSLPCRHGGAAGAACSAHTMAGERGRGRRGSPRLRARPPPRWKLRVAAANLRTWRKAALERGGGSAAERGRGSQGMGRAMSPDLWEKVLETSVQRLALLETPSGFALFNIEHKVFEYPQAIWAWLTDVRRLAMSLARVLAFIKVDKSVAKSDDGPGEELSRVIKKYYRSGRELYVEDEKLRCVIYSNLNIKCSDDNYVVHEVMWGLRNIVYDVLFEERDNITCRFYLTKCKGLEACMSAFKLSPEADDMLYARVMAKILTPGLEPDWNFTEKFPEDMVVKLKEKEAKAEAAREEVGYQMYQFMHATFLNLNGLPGIMEKAADSLRGHNENINPPHFTEESCEVLSSQDGIEGSSKTHFTEESCEVLSSQDGIEGPSKRSRIDEWSYELPHC